MDYGEFVILASYPTVATCQISPYSEQKIARWKSVNSMIYAAYMEMQIQSFSFLKKKYKFKSSPLLSIV